MNKTIKIIDLLNKIANCEEIPKKIRIAGWCYNFEWEEHDENYYDKNGNIDLMSCLSMCSDDLNREVEIIEDNKKIEDDFEFTLSGNVWTTKQASELIDNLSKLEKRLVDHINKIEEKLDER